MATREHVQIVPVLVNRVRVIEKPKGAPLTLWAVKPGAPLAVVAGGVTHAHILRVYLFAVGADTARRKDQRNTQHRAQLAPLRRKCYRALTARCVAPCPGVPGFGVAKKSSGANHRRVKPCACFDCRTLSIVATAAESAHLLLYSLPILLGQICAVCFSRYFDRGQAGGRQTFGQCVEFGQCVGVLATAARYSLQPIAAQLSSGRDRKGAQLPPHLLQCFAMCHVSPPVFCKGNRSHFHTHTE